ncbi:MAG TPA: DmsE family decaheme c-type cytochrome [Bryobacteraceae bacterium]|jgi:DmsE family decaheme c-type cytochrome|nr:DmsE family decaheme c-type cytochrome [Bryobacteraceae bacterium]
MARAGWLVLWFLVWVGVAAAQTQLNVTHAPGGFVGSNACRTCHPDVWHNFYRNPHFKTLVSGDAPPARSGCEGCHGPGAAHVEARGGKATIPHAFSLMTTAQVMEDCLGCHARDFGKVNIQRSEHTLNGVACTNCHSIHHSSASRHLLAKPEHELCYTCHATIRAQFAMPSKHRVDEGFMECSDCHNPHGAFAPTSAMGQRPRMVEQALGNEQPCLKCHADKRGPFVYEHPSVAVEGCNTCHYPHGSMNARLLRRPVVFTLCLECHNGGGSGTRNQGVDIQSARHNLLDPRFQRCTACHVRIHGSNADQYFLR